MGSIAKEVGHILRNSIPKAHVGLRVQLQFAIGLQLHNPPPPPHHHHLFTVEGAYVVYPTEDITISARDGDVVVLKCEGSGFPAPDVALIRPGLTRRRVTDSESSSPQIIKKTIVATRETLGKYQCAVSNTIVQGKGGAKFNFVYRTISLQVEPGKVFIVCILV